MNKTPGVFTSHSRISSTYTTIVLDSVTGAVHNVGGNIYVYCQGSESPFNIADEEVGAAFINALIEHNAMKFAPAAVATFEQIGSIPAMADRPINHPSVGWITQIVNGAARAQAVQLPYAGPPRNIGGFIFHLAYQAEEAVALRRQVERLQEEAGPPTAMHDELQAKLDAAVLERADAELKLERANKELAIYRAYRVAQSSVDRDLSTSLRNLPKE